MSVTFCRDCGASLARGKRFCGECGAPVRSRPRVAREALVAAHHRDVRHSAAVAVVFAGTLGGMLLFGALAVSLGVTVGGLALVAFAVQVAAGLVACLVLGGRALRASFGGAPRALDVALGVAVGVVSFGIARGYVGLFGDPGVRETPEPAFVAAVVLGAPLVEEWLDRGVLWRALEPLTSTLGTVVVSALLFGLMHGLNGGWVLEVPHRFAAGLLLGWLRARSGSLVPGIVGHAVLNGIAVGVDI